MAQLNIGDKAPDFELPLTLETTWKLSDYVGKKNILLLFVPLKAESAPYQFEYIFIENNNSTKHCSPMNDNCKSNILFCF